VIIRLPLDPILAGAGFSYSFFPVTDHFNFTLTQGAEKRGTMFWASHDLSLFSVRIYRWDEDSGTIFFDDVGISTYGIFGGRDCAGPDGRNWSGRFDDRILGAWVGRQNVIGIMWNSTAHGAFPRPYSRVARFTRDTRTLIDEPVIWNADVCWLYPSAAANARGDVGVTINYGGLGSYPSCAVMIDDDLNAAPPPWENVVLAAGNSGPDTDRWGDYNTTHAFQPSREAWIAACHVLRGGTSGTAVEPRYGIFGRERDRKSITRWIDM
jgi:hypothetical protein